MKIAIIDADLIGRKKHRFPNLACMKLSGYYKDNGNSVTLKTDYENLQQYDMVFISKVFTDTPISEDILKFSNVKIGGTGFYYDKAPKLPEEIEHHMPDYHLYNDWVAQKIQNGAKRNDFKYYLDYSIGFTTRGCFRQCQFCVNKNYKKVQCHSPISEFYDEKRKKICLLDDNILGSPFWKEIFEELQRIGKPFQYKQGMDERLLTDEKCKVIFNSKYDGDFIFAFDNIADSDLIQSKLKLLRNYTNKIPKFYVFCGFDRNNKWDDDFWKQDIIDLFERIKILAKYKCLPYIMRFNRYEESPYRGIYINVAAWCNQPAFFKKLSYGEWCDKETLRGKLAAKKYNDNLIKKNPNLKYIFDIKFNTK